MNNLKEKIICLLLAAGLLLSPQFAAADKQEVTLEQLLTRALDESPLVKKIAAQTTQSRALGIEVSALENPILDSEFRFPASQGGSRGMSEVALALSQPLRVSDFGTRTRINELIQSAASQDEKAELLAFSQRIRLAYIKLWALSQRENEVAGNLTRITKIEKHVSAAAQGGFILPSEKALFKAEALKARYQLKALSADRMRARAELSKLVGFVVEEGLKAPTLHEIPSEEELLEKEERLPAQARAKLALQLALEQQKGAELDAYPKFAPRIVYERNDDASEYVGLGISFDLPVFNRNESQRSVHTSEVAASRSLDNYFSGEAFVSEVKALRAHLEVSRQLLSGYQKEIVPALREAVAEEERLLSAGQGNFFRMWQSLRELTEAENEVVERMVRTSADCAELSLLIGADI